MGSRVAVLAVGTAATTLALTFATGSSATTTGVDLGVTGSTVAGVARGQQGLELGFTFTVSNHSDTTSADLSINFTVTHGSVGSADYICPLISNHLDINADGSACEPGSLRHGRSTSAAILVTPSGTGTVSVRACAMNNSGATDPVASNDCKTISVPIS